MNEDYAYSKRQYEERVIIPAKQKARRELAVSILLVMILAGAYIGQEVFHWW